MRSAAVRVHRLLSAPALQFKGSGWYINDYAKSGSSSRDKSEKSEKNGGGSSASESKSGSDSKSNADSKAGSGGEERVGTAKGDSTKPTSPSSTPNSSKAPAPLKQNLNRPI